MDRANRIKEIIEYKQRRLDELADPNEWERITKNMECGEYKEFKQHCIDEEIIIAALREQEQYDTLLKAFHDRLELDGLECDHCKHGGFECGTCPQTDEFAKHCEFWEWSGLGGAN